MQQFQQRAQMQQSMQLIRVTGMDGAKAYQMPPNSVVPLFDADNDIMYVKSTDGAGFPTIRAFAFQPVEDKPEPAQQYVTRDEFDAAMKPSQGLASVGYENLRNFAQTQDTIKDGNYSLSSQLANCCCTTQRGIDSVNYNGAINTAAVQQTVAEQTQKVLDTITGNRMADMQNQINQLQLSQAMCGVVRYPNTFAYNAGPSPFCGNGCCGTANI